MKTFIIFTPAGDKIINADEVVHDLPTNRIVLLKNDENIINTIAAFNLEKIYGWSEAIEK